MKIAITGHRPDKIGGYQDNPLTRAIGNRLGGIIEAMTHKHGLIITISGMALGTDTLWACLAESWGLPLLAAVPFAGQELMWPRASQEVYGRLIKYAKSTEDRGGGVVIVSPGGYSRAKMQKRNEWMVDQLADPLDRLIAVWDGSTGGTANCMHYACQKLEHDQIIRVNPSNIIV